MTEKSCSGAERIVVLICFLFITTGIEDTTAEEILTNYYQYNAAGNDDEEEEIDLKVCSIP